MTHLFDMTGANIVFPMPPAGRIQLKTVTGHTVQITSQQGKNLFKFNTGTSASSGLTVTIEENGDIHISGLATNTSAVSLYDTHFPSYLLNLLNAGDIYTLSSNSQSGNIYIQINYIPDGSSSETAIASVFGHNYKSFALPSGTGFRIFIGVMANAGTLDETFHVQLEKGSTATTYEPFTPNSPSPDYQARITGTTTLTVSDGRSNSHDYLWAQTGYSLPNGTHDTKEFVSNVEIHNVGKVVLDGTTAIFKCSVKTGTEVNTVAFQTSAISNIRVPASSYYRNVDWLLSTHFPYKDTPTSTYYNKDVLWGFDISFITIDTLGKLAFRIPKTNLSGWSDDWTNAQIVSAANHWLSSNPVTVLYELAVPQTITGAAIVSLAWPYREAKATADGGMVSLSVYNEWTEPKTDWTANDYFNLYPDYNRIKSNIEYLQKYSEAMYSAFELIHMGNFTVDGFPADTFLNNIVDNVTALESNLFKPPQNEEMQRYSLGAPGWDYRQLNIIESNIGRLHDAMVGQWNCLMNMPVPFGLGVDDF